MKAAWRNVLHSDGLRDSVLKHLMLKDVDRYLIVYINKSGFLPDETFKGLFLNSTEHLFVL